VKRDASGSAVQLVADFIELVINDLTVAVNTAEHGRGQAEMRLEAQQESGGDPRAIEEAAARRQNALLLAHRARRRLDGVKALRSELAGRHEVVARLAEQHGLARSAPAWAPVPDPAGQETKPSPEAAGTPAEYVAALRQYRVWAGGPSFRAMADRAGSGVGYSTICAALGRDDLLPRQHVAEAVIRGCGAGEEDVRAFVAAWRRIALGKPVPGSARLSVVPVGALGGSTRRQAGHAAG
jgi:hypothetical protein